MFRNPREVEPDKISSQFSQILKPLPAISWGQLAMFHLGVPVMAGHHMFVVQDEHYQTAIQKLKDLGFPQAPPDRRAAPEVMASLSNPQAVLDKINKGYARLDHDCTPFRVPPHLPFRGDQIYIIPNSFAHLPLNNLDLVSTSSSQEARSKQYDVYDNLFYPLEAALVESFAKAIVHDIDEVEFSAWQLTLNSWVALMVSYVEVNNDILDNCADERAVEWYSTKFGRIHEAEHGKWDLRVSKRIGSGQEPPVDMRGNPIT